MNLNKTDTMIKTNINIVLNFEPQVLLRLTLFEKWKILLYYAVELLLYLLNTYILNKLLLNLVLELLLLI